jgi:hypothetical protein
MMSDTELLLKEVEGLPAHYMGEILDFVGYLKHKAPPVEQAQGGKPAKSMRGILKGKGITITEFEKMQCEDLLLEEGRE